MNQCRPVFEKSLGYQSGSSVTEQVIFDHYCNVNVTFHFSGFKSSARQERSKKTAGFMILRRRTVTAGEASGRRLGKEAEDRVSVLLIFLGSEIKGFVSFGLRSGGCRKRNERRRRGGESSR